AGEVIAVIDTEASAQTSPISVKAIPSAAPNAPIGAAPAAAPTADQSKAGVAMPAAAKILAENNLSASDVGGSGRDGRVTKGDALAATANKPAAAPAPKAALQQVAAPAPANPGDRPEERVPMSRLRARIAERLLQSQSTNAILTTFNEVNMA